MCSCICFDVRKIEFEKNIYGLNQVHLPLLEMARTVKVSKEKAKKERAREAGDKKLADMKKIERGKSKEGTEDKG